MNFIGNRYSIDNNSDIYIGKIYKATDLFDNNKVLIKLVEHNKHVKEGFMENLIDEMTMLNQIKSPYILPIIDIGIHYAKGKILYYIVSEYTKGISLKDIIKGNYLHLEAIISIATQIVRGLEEIYSHNIYHGGLNLDNIIVDKWYNIKIAGLGITKANNGINIRERSSIRYLCPHQLCINHSDKESDFFSLGLILYQAIFNNLPFEEGKDEIEMLKIIDKGINWNNVNTIDNNEQLINIVKKLLDRKDKYKSTQEIVLDLSSIMYEKAEIQESIEIENEQRHTDMIHNKKLKRVMLIAACLSIIFSMIVSMI